MFAEDRFQDKWGLVISMVALAVMTLSTELIGNYIPVQDVATKVKQHGTLLLMSWTLVGLTRRHLIYDLQHTDQDTTDQVCGCSRSTSFVLPVESSK